MVYKEYLKDVKNATHIRIGVGLLLYCSRKILLEKRSDCKKWGLIGGEVETGESVEDTALRECLEETSINLKIEDLKLFGIYSDINEYRVIKYPDNCFHAIDLIYSYELKVDNLSIKKSKESIAISFFSIDSLPKDIVPPAKKPLNDFLKSKFNI